MVNSIWQGWGVTEVLVVTVAALSSYLMQRYLLDPLRKIPGPRGLPFIGNLLMLQPERMHHQLFDLAKQYGSVLKIGIFNKTIVVLNSADVCIEVLTKKGTDFLGRPPVPRITYLLGADVSFMSFDHPSYPLLRRVTTKGLKAYGTGMAHLEKIMQEVIQDSMEILNSKDGQPVDTFQLSSGYVCSVMVSILYGEVRTYEDPICLALNEMNRRVLHVGDPASRSAIMDIFPVLFKFRRFLFNNTYHFLEESKEMVDEQVSKKLQEAKETYDKNYKRGCVDYFIESQREEVDNDGNQILSDSEIQGLLIDFTVAGMETSLASLCQSFLDLLHDKALMKGIQAQIDKNFEPGQHINLNDREKLPLLEAYLLENLRILTQVPLLLPHATLRDTEIAGYKIPAGTRVFCNSFCVSHDEDTFPEPFKCKPERFLDSDGKVVNPGHPARKNFIGFGAGRRQCPGEHLAKSRLFLLLANILQKFDIEPVGELPDRDVRNYKMGLVIKPPPVSAKFTLRL